MSRPPAADATITPGSPQPARACTSASFFACRFPPHGLRFFLLLPASLPLDAIRTMTGLDIDLRWPNDLLIGPRKTGGILVESRTESKRLPHAVVGIGINVHQREFAPDLATPATSLDLETGHRISRQALLVALLKSLEQETQALSNPAAAKTILARVEQASTWTRGRSVQVHGPQACEGVTAGLDENGFLRVKTANGLVTVQTGGLRAGQKHQASSS